MPSISRPATVGVTVQDADDSDTTTCVETLIEAAEQVEAVRPDGEGIEEIVGDKGYHSNQSLVDFEAVGVRRHISEPDRGRRNWKKNPAARDAVYRNRRRIRGARGLRLLRLRGERLERPFAHLYETGGMRRVHLRGHTNIRKRLLIHTAGFNLGLIMRQLIGVGTPRGLQGRLITTMAALLALIGASWNLRGGHGRSRATSFIFVIFASGSCGWVQSSFEPFFFRLRSTRAKSACEGVSIPDACASFVRKSS